MVFSKRLASVLLAAVVVVSACSSSSSPAPSSAPGATATPPGASAAPVGSSVLGAGAFASDGSLARVQQAKKLVVCTSNDVPYSYLDPKTNTLAGTDIDILKATAKHMGIDQFEMNQVPISGIIQALQSGRCDIIADNIAITLKRETQITFSNPQYRAGHSLIVMKGNPKNIQSERDFSGKAVASYEGTIQLDWLNQLAAKDPTIEVKAYKDIPSILADFRAGRLDAAVFDSMVAGYSLKIDPTLPIQVLDYQLPIVSDYAVGIGFRNEDVSLRLAFNEANRQIERSGELKSILNTWGLLPESRYYPFPRCCEQ